MLSLVRSKCMCEDFIRSGWTYVLRLLGQQGSDVDVVDERKIDQVWQDMKWLEWCCGGESERRGHGICIASWYRGMEIWRK